MLFLPFDQRMTRDMKALRERRQARRETASLSGKSSRSRHHEGAHAAAQLINLENL